MFPVAILVQFSQSTFSGDEASGAVHITLLLAGGTSTVDINVTVIPSDQTPVSAEGKKCTVGYLINEY